MYGKRDDTNSVRYMGHQRLLDMAAAGKGRSKHADKQTAEGTAAYIYSSVSADGKSDTASDYHRKWDYFCDSMDRAGFTVEGHKPRTFEEAAEYMPRYIEELEQRPGKAEGSTMSAWSVRSYFAAAGKVLDLSASDYDLPARRASDITRSRFSVENDKHFSGSSAKYEGFVDFCCATGLRKNKELRDLRGSQLVDHGDGSYSVHILQGKGGKERYAPITGTPDQVEAVVSRMRAAGEDKVWSSLPKCADVHSYRAIYAKRVYEAHARPIASVPRSERYYCQGDHRGEIYDKAALDYATEALGHSRHNVLIQSYLWADADR